MPSLLTPINEKSDKLAQKSKGEAIKFPILLLLSDKSAQKVRQANFFLIRRFLFAL